MFLKLRPKQEAKPLSLPVLLSFNELAWLAVGAITLVFVAFWKEYRDLKNDTRRKITETEYRELANRPVVHPGQIIVEESLWHQLRNPSGIVQMPLPEYTQMTNKRFLLPNEIPVTRSIWDALTNSQGIRLPIKEYSELTNRPRLRPDEMIVKKSFTLDMTNAWNATRRFSNLWQGARVDHSNELYRLQFEGQIRAELLNLMGRLSNVVIVLDRSASMNQKDKQIDRWEDALRVVESWLRHLPIRRCALLVFSDRCDPFPTNRTFMEISEKSRTELIREVRQLKPDGNTATALALSEAYNYRDVDTIILFTDGKPFVPKTGRDGGRHGGEAIDMASISSAEIQRVLDLAARHPGIPVNVVGLGDYFEKEQSTFLLKLARSTGGSFLGR